MNKKQRIMDAESKDFPCPYCGEKELIFIDSDKKLDYVCNSCGRGFNQIPKGFKKAICKCGNGYAYCGLDMGLCVKCLDNLEVEEDEE